MKSEDIIVALGDVSEEFVASAAVKKKRKLKAWLIPSAAVAACLGIAAVGIFALRGRNETPKWPVEEVYLGAIETNAATEATWNETELGTYVEPKWDEKKATEKFTWFELDGVEYSVSRRDEPLAEGEIGASLGEVGLLGYDIYTDSTHESFGEAFELKGISPECALGLRIDGDTATYVYINRWYSPETLEDFLTDLNFEENVFFGGANMNWYDDEGELSRVEFEDFDDSAVWDMLLSDGSLENMGDVTVIAKLIVSVSHEPLGYENMVLCICEDGTVWTNILGMQKSFFVGKEKTEAFIEWVIDNVPGKQIVYIYPETDATDVEVEDTGDGTVVAFTSSGYNPGVVTEGEPPVVQSTYTDENGAMISPPYSPETSSSTLRAKIVEINGDSLLIEPCEGQLELSSADRIFFSAEWLPEKFTPAVGNILVIEYDGLLMETYPARINEPFSVVAE